MPDIVPARREERLYHLTTQGGKNKGREGQPAQVWNTRGEGGQEWYFLKDYIFLGFNNNYIFLGYLMPWNWTLKNGQEDKF